MIKQLIYLLLIVALIVGIADKEHKITDQGVANLFYKCGYKIASSYHFLVDDYNSYYESDIDNQEQEGA